MSEYTYESLSQYSRKVESLYSKYVLDPVAKWVALPILNRTNWQPFFITLIATAISLISALMFLNGQFVIGAVLFQMSVVLDLVDGYVARAKKNGSVFGIMLDVYSDMIRIFINILALSYYYIGNTATSVLLLLFLVLNFAESFVNIKFSAVKSFLKEKSVIQLTRVDDYLLSIKEHLEHYGLKVNLLYFQERIFCVLFLGPVFGMVKLFTVTGIVLVLISIHLKLFLDIALIKQDLIYSRNFAKGV